DSSGNYSYGTPFPGAGFSTLHVVAGQTYYVQAGSLSSTGAYQLTVAAYADDAGNTQADATPLDVAPSGSVSRSGALEVAGDVDVYQYTAPVSTALSVSLSTDSTPAAFLTAWDSAGNYYGGYGFGSILTLDVAAGQTYY